LPVTKFSHHRRIAPAKAAAERVVPDRIMRRLIPAAFGITALALGAGGAAAASDTPDIGKGPTFGSRTEKPDGSTALTIGRRLPTAWETKVGTDLSLAAPHGATAADNLLAHDAAGQSSGAVWGNLTMPGIAPPGFDKTSIEARLDAGKDEGKLGATLSRSMPLDGTFVLTLQNSYAATQTLATAPVAAVPPASPTTPLAPSNMPSLSMGETLRLEAGPFGTAFSAGAASSTSDPQWHSKLSVEQTLFGPLKLTTTVENAGAAASNKTIKAGYKVVW
jgi:hypothetical protein